MIRKSIIAIGIIVLAIAMAVIVGLVLLRLSVDNYAQYWNGRANQPGELLYVALGDSAAQGLGASKPDNGYVGLIANQITSVTGRRVRVVNLSTTGATAFDVRANQLPRLAQLQPDIVTIDIGANDAVRGTPVASFRSDFEAIIQALPPGRSAVADIPYFGGRIRADTAVTALNAEIRLITQEYDVALVPLYAYLQSRQSPLIYAVDAFHPNDRGYQKWFQAFNEPLKPLIQQATLPNNELSSNEN